MNVVLMYSNKIDNSFTKFERAYFYMDFIETEFENRNMEFCYDMEKEKPIKIKKQIE